MLSFASGYSHWLSLLSVYLLSLGINFNYLQRLDVILLVLPDRPSKFLSILFLLTVPSVLKGITKILPRKSFFKYFILWSVTLTIISFLVAKILDVSTPFSVYTRLIEQLVGFICSVCIGYYTFIALIRFPFLFKRILLYSLYLVFFGIGLQIFLLGISSSLDLRLFGITGEPKGLSMFLIPFIFSLFFGQSFKNPSSWLTPGIALLALVFTKSISGYFGLLALALTATLISLPNISKKIVYLWLLMSSFICLVFNNSNLQESVIFRFFKYLQSDKIDGIQEVFTFPFIGSIVVEANELPVLLHFERFPFFIFTGFGLGQESTWCIGYIEQLGGIGFLDSKFDGYINPNSAILANTATYGLLFFILVFVFSIHHYIFIYKQIHDPDQMFILNFVSSNLFLSLIIFKASFPMVAAFTFICLLYSYLKIASVQNRQPLGLIVFSQSGA